MDNIFCLAMVMGSASFGTIHPNVAPSWASTAVAGSVPTLEMRNLDTIDDSQSKYSKKKEGNDDSIVCPSLKSKN